MNLTGTGLGYGSQAYGTAGVYQGAAPSPPVTPITITGAAGYGVTAYGQPLIWSTDTTPAPTPAPPPASTGGWAFPTPKVRSKEEIQAEREALGIIEKPVERAVAKVAAKVVAKAEASKEALKLVEPDFNALDYLEARHDQERRALAEELRRQKIEFSLHFMILLRLEVEKRLAQDAEDEQIVMLLMEM